MGERFDWDPHKELINIKKHGIDFVTATGMWSGVHIKMETHPGNDKNRWLVIGEIGGWAWTAVITYREGAVSIISVRRARDYKRRALYEYKRSQEGQRGHGGGD